MSSPFGRLFRITTWGESHGGGIGVVVDGCPPGIVLDLDAIQAELDRRRPGRSKLASARQEADRLTILSGLHEGRTLGSPIAISVANTDARPGAYEHLRDLYRPSHGDYSHEAKYGLRDWRGGGRASARETVGRVAAGAIARQLLTERCGVEIVAWVEQLAGIDASLPDPASIDRATVESTPVRCPDPAAAARMIERIEAARAEGNSLGGIIATRAGGLPAGWGDPVFDKLDALLAHAMLSIPACKGFDLGSGFAGTRMTGADHNDAFVMEGDRVRTRTNRSGGVQAGISNGEPLLFRSAFKPTPTIRKEQDTVDRRGNAVKLSAHGRHDPCVLPRAVPIVEAMTALVLADCYLRQLAVDRR